MHLGTLENNCILESNLKSLINKENELLIKLKNKNNFNEITNDYNQLKLFSSSLNINFENSFSKNDSIQKFLTIGHLSSFVIIYSFIIIYINYRIILEIDKKFK